MHILLAEDNRVNQRICEKMFKRIGGCSYAIVNNGREALDYLAGPPDTCPRPDIILMDISMPVVAGVEATDIIRSQAPFVNDPKIRMTPIIGLHPYATPRARGMTDMLSKPIRMSHLTKLLLQYSRHEPVPVGFGAPHMRMAPVWGPMPMRKFPGPRSRL
ncbi:response regulator [Aspergillus affinis]|uniref:response regulator n=1 Tax=Aspergillus affinis TaxID=1070780 RepID=UPI0022FEC0EA|nr:CheY-like protein [Aspergillus affinis]KAI9038113.1 CheY-like protein [Aspergillus affinis]